MKSVTISITGPVGSGKTLLGNMLREFLSSKGVMVGRLIPNSHTESFEVAFKIEDIFPGKSKQSC